MDFENLAESEVLVAVGATVAVLSPRVRSLVRRGAVYGLAGLLMAGDLVVGAARGVARGAQDGASNAVVTVQEASERLRTAAANGAEETVAPPAAETPDAPRPNRGRGRATTEATAHE